jgi:NADPH-dependent F420 reductase
MIGFIGGTGPEGRGLALRFALAGEQVIIGSRDIGRAEEAAQSIAEHAPEGSIQGALNDRTATESDVVFVAVPFGGHRATLEGLRDQLDSKIVVDVVAPLAFSRGQVSAILVDEGSAAQQAQKILPNSRIVAAFQNISAEDLLIPDRPIESDVIVCSDDAEAKAQIIALADVIVGTRGIDGGKLENARYVEDFTALLLNINRIYKAHSTIKIVGI